MTAEAVEREGAGRTDGCAFADLGEPAWLANAGEEVWFYFPSLMTSVLCFDIFKWFISTINVIIKKKMHSLMFTGVMSNMNKLLLKKSAKILTEPFLCAQMAMSN